MTTIAYKDGILAGDTRLTDDSGYIWSDNCRKVFKLPDGSLFAAAGDSEGGELLLKSLRGEKDVPELESDMDITAVRITPSGELFLTEGATWTRWHEPYVAIGSGKRAALAALQLGSNAVVAVRIGMKGDCYSGGRVQTVKLKGIK
jgi:20S proteasome alpha/beta subunit